MENEENYNNLTWSAIQVMQLFKLSVTGLSLRETGFDPRPINVGFMTDQLALELVSLQVLRFSHVSIVPPL
jgi:hypothetical protein